MLSFHCPLSEISGTASLKWPMFFLTEQRASLLSLGVKKPAKALEWGITIIKLNQPQNLLLDPLVDTSCVLLHFPWKEGDKMIRELS